MENGNVTNKIARLIDVKKELDERKKLYEEYDDLIADLKANGFTSIVFNGLHVELISGFPKGKNSAWKAVNFKEYDVLVETLDEYRERLADAEKKQQKKLAKELKAK